MKQGPTTWGRRLLLVMVCVSLCLTALMPANAHADDGPIDGPLPEITTINGLAGKRVGSPSASTMDIILKQHVDGTVTIEYFNTFTDMIAALKAGKIDAFIADEPVAELLVNRNTGIALLPEPVQEDNYGFALPKGSPLTPKFDQVIQKFRDDGTLDELREEWCGADEEAKQILEQDWDTSAGTLKVAVDGTSEPMGYIQDGKVVGYTIDLLLMCCRELGYGVRMQEMSFDAMLASIQTGKVDLGCSSISITEERRQSMDLTTPMYNGAITAVVRAEADPNAAGGFFAELAKSFERTFITEGRWKLILKGLGITLLIAVFSGILGTLLGYASMRWRNTGSKVATKVINFCEVLLGRLPIVVVLMVFYYVVFGAFSISGIIVAIVVFTLSFGAVSESIMWNAVSSIDPGQREASLALGFTESETFNGVVFPQALRRFLPLLSGSIVSLIKDTSVVGFIAVTDLTRAGDLIRSRTMEAFFPLLAVAAIYFITCSAVAAIMGSLIKRLDQSNRPRTIEGVEL